MSAFILYACGNTGSKTSKKSMQTENQEQLKEAIAPETSNITFDFENYPSGQLPVGWSQYFSGRGGTNWQTAIDNGNKVLAQLYSDNPGNHFNIVVNDSIRLKNMTLTVRLKGITGKEDQGGGLIWRFTDKDNYYIVRANPLEDNVVLYKVQDGKRGDLPLVGKGKTYGVKVEPLGNTWHALKLIVKDDLFTVFLDGKELYKVQDSTFTFEGKIGLWTKADAVTWFDDYLIVPD